MSSFNFYHPMEVRYSDLDPQGHLNNVKYLSFFEHARISYIKHLDLWNGDSFLDIGIILADAHVTFYSPVEFGQKVRVGVRVSRIGNKSLEMEYTLEDVDTGREQASGKTTLVAYNYHSQKSISVPIEWRRLISEFEELYENM